MKTNEYETYCDKCNTTFDIKLKVEDLEHSIQKTSFTCPECGKEYLVSIMDDDMRRKQKEMNLVQKKLQRPGNPAVKRRQFKRYIKLKNQLKIALGEMKRQYQGVDE